MSECTQPLHCCAPSGGARAAWELAAGPQSWLRPRPLLLPSPPNQSTVMPPQEEPGQPGSWRLDHSHGGPGCDPALLWQPETWKRALVRPRKAPVTTATAAGKKAAASVPLKGLQPTSHLSPDIQTAAEVEEVEEVYEVVFPTREAAASCPRVVVRHARDPELEEKQLVHRLHKEMERSIALHSIGEEGG